MSLLYKLRHYAIIFSILLLSASVLADDMAACVLRQLIADDYQSAFPFCKSAAEQGDAKAQYNLGVLYLTGEDIFQNFKEAYIWFSLAVITGDEKSVEGRELAKQFLTPSEIESALQEAKHRLAEIDSRKNQR